MRQYSSVINEFTQSGIVNSVEVWRSDATFVSDRTVPSPQTVFGQIVKFHTESRVLDTKIQEQQS
jgi:hypothetical protein